MIRNHAWFTINAPKEEVVLGWGKEIQEDVLKNVESLGIDINCTLESLNTGKYNHATAVY